MVGLELETIGIGQHAQPQATFRATLATRCLISKGNAVRERFRLGCTDLPALPIHLEDVSEVGGDLDRQNGFPRRHAMVADLYRLDHAIADEPGHPDLDRILWQVGSLCVASLPRKSKRCDPRVRLDCSATYPLGVFAVKRQPIGTDETAVVVEEAASVVPGDRSVGMAQEHSPVSECELMWKARVHAHANCVCRTGADRGICRAPELHMRSDRNGRVVAITGATAGVGRALVRLYASQGAAIGLIARGTDGLQGAQADATSLGSEALALPTDVADHAAVEQAAQEIERAYGPIDLWINNAMLSVFSAVRDTTPDEFKRVTDVTYLGAVYGTLAALRRMLPRDRGTIVLVGSALAYRGIPLQAAYCAAKHAMQGFHDSLRTELLHDRSAVRVTMVQLPAVNTPQFDWSRSRLPRRAQPVPPIFQPEMAAHAIAWAADHPHASRELVVGWPALKAILADKLAPSFADHVLARSGYDDQQTDQPEPRGRADNLWEPLDGPGGGDHGAHGRFDATARDKSMQLWANTHRPALGVAAMLVGGLALAGVVRKRA